MRRVALCIMSKEWTAAKGWSRLGVRRVAINWFSYQHGMSYGSLYTGSCTLDGMFVS